MRRVHGPVPPEAFDCAERRAAVDPELASLLEQPLVRQLVTVADVLVRVAAQVGANHVGLLYPGF